MIKKLMLSAAALTCVLCASVPAQGATHITTKWADEVDVNNVRGEYPRPTMVRGEWKNLNGEWDYGFDGWQNHRAILPRIGSIRC